MKNHYITSLLQQISRLKRTLYIISKVVIRANGYNTLYWKYKHKTDIRPHCHKNNSISKSELRPKRLQRTLIIKNHQLLLI